MTAITTNRESNWKVYLIMFIIYSVGGSVGEHLAYYFSHKVKRLKNPIMEGFPLYGIGAYTLVIIMRIFENFSPNEKWQEVLHNWIFQFILSAVVLTFLEYMGGKIVGAGKKNKDGHIETWDYTDTFMNYQGIVNLKHFILHGILGLIVLQTHDFLVKWINRLFEPKDDSAITSNKIT